MMQSLRYLLKRCYLCSKAIEESNKCEATEPCALMGLLKLEGSFTPQVSAE